MAYADIQVIFDALGLGDGEGDQKEKDPLRRELSVSHRSDLEGEEHFSCVRGNEKQISHTFLGSERSAARTEERSAAHRTTAASRTFFRRSWTEYEKEA
ncbi:Hypothetical predicted protein [Podarcis lilfordi]|uniref:Uncharacterized protein n=1 Tax=Podarcis lilfordi TaxID=74358 RepID=A0AA35JQ20_9SAUR|nr:Hypothetical predicted protein [Podarcis lilfordi]